MPRDEPQVHFTWRRWIIYQQRHLVASHIFGNMSFTVYFLESRQDTQRHYIGFTENIKKRIIQHNQGLVTSTKKFRPWKIIYLEIYPNKADALGRERFLKSGSGWKFLQKQLFHHFSTQ
ncbi:MAG: excinuclease ABC subunit C [Candidatus Magasanikbacteria bacterium CG_4_9_14_0_2_um_filter_42_11]|uniref:Excinuclease ABC subunit C n=1 Tax=Candidatus Magasanikbacteria bacterium CG_4_9_14_0_2_um_filter_42_11 TaxID=1974643 RepID=A0A2M8F8Y3_9BACT|nr:MAG: excinuclease ABC subunit C [Candidatus Magasanikbacteria bacterium CG10_big_fil_rev_8_21_14_0_10_43_9]PIY92112.1 MAG: excinuclease ABC subunit C [Candidatus Magasanikbacteria bacterium CG_4_10_14_0_8_um_filter_42_12]PJC52166.1 MAG: excinuclease ABC subunit C [Candidatus Magasanikbacteria bacterium CG_4_9_14_0_2_um_filter_42_11]